MKTLSQNKPLQIFLVVLLVLLILEVGFLIYLSLKNVNQNDAILSGEMEDLMDEQQTDEGVDEDQMASDESVDERGSESDGTGTIADEPVSTSSQTTSSIPAPATCSTAACLANYVRENGCVVGSRGAHSVPPMEFFAGLYVGQSLSILINANGPAGCQFTSTGSFAYSDPTGEYRSIRLDQGDSDVQISQDLEDFNKIRTTLSCSVTEEQFAYYLDQTHQGNMTSTSTSSTGEFSFYDGLLTNENCTFNITGM